MGDEGAVMATGVAEKIVDGLTEFGTATGDVAAARMGGMMYRDVAAGLDPLVQSQDRCRLAFVTMLIRPDLRVGCLAAVLADRLIVAWKPGFFRKPAAQ